MSPRFSPSWSSNMSINIRRNLLVVAGTFLFKVINIEKKHKVVFVLHYVSLHCTMDGLDGCTLKLVSRTGRRYQFWSYFLEGWGGKNALMHHFLMNVSITWFTMCPWPAPWRKLMAGAKLGRPVKQYNEMTAMFISCFATESFQCWVWIIRMCSAGFKILGILEV